MSPLSVPKIFMAGGAVGFGYYLFMRQYWFPNPYKTQGVQNIEDRFSAGGGHPTHTPAGGTQRGTGSASANEGRHDGPSKGPDSEHFKKNISDQQSEPVWPSKFNEIQYNNPKGK
ncbi:uncharacterized protein J4E88_006732 [Alternaria novae-zelandiae]|uniref:uncharacterized protein n=1 Tax=Alternaria metachromatica TaxID=283354 RepID=UPI0020C5185C|nr:uncharacterized protein J4E83_007357 [Alternaria metachromatica]XP_049197428.1 uncharacterized protein J4E93_007288 [Alternaria ventricosa]XP_049210504.1 uncharacterized protein J4E79_006237 [Alternaria viburni]XP_049231255.1 uncharacterized protein J4E87_007389 [Alternaria ethzedia]XP_049246198.1 uncharacterized protein J4E84_003740 [Alternaria hordeiaustralica]XP_049253973.1 uncharacterized protein J4E88_006732 [Alternaria novae-zelandiae]XP_051293509.1 uncharacterized protein J4E90_0025